MGTARPGCPHMGYCGMALVSDAMVSELYINLICGSGWGGQAGVDNCIQRGVERLGRDVGKSRIRLKAVHGSLVTAYGRLVATH